ncbi:hypothetical protein HOF65_06600 [bacterium]|nr:hypothetical protein [bacterium]MBT5492224.1 hypothetical protein [bacterium]MBT6778778.1 hypothetical protein [bacterium]
MTISFLLVNDFFALIFLIADNSGFKDRSFLNIKYKYIEDDIVTVNIINQVFERTSQKLNQRVVA